MGAVPYVGGIVLLGIVVPYLLLNLSLLILLVLGLWFTFPVLAVERTGLSETVTFLYEYLRDHFVDSLVNLGMVLLVMMVFKWLIFAFCMGAFSLTSLALSHQTTTYVEQTFQEDETESEARNFPLQGRGMQQSAGLFQSFFGQLLFALMFSVMAAVITGPVLAIFYSGGCAVYLNGSDT